MKIHCAGLVSLLFAVATLGMAPAAYSADQNSTLPENPQPASVAGEPVTRNATWRSLPVDFLHDQKDIWLFPVQLAKGHHWVPILAVAAGTAGLIYADPHIEPYFRDHAKNIDKPNDVFDPMITTSEIIAVPTALLAAGYIRHSPYEVSSALDAAEAYGDSAIVDLALKAVTRRQRPSDIPPGAPFTGTFFNGGKSPLKGSSFPSGHSTGAFSVATVIAVRYSRHKWVPYAAYGMATLIGLSRISTRAHFASDVFLGSALGYSVARFQTLSPR